MLTFPTTLFAGLSQITQVLSATSTAATIAWPAVQKGDLAVLQDFAASGVSTPTDVTPTGFTAASNSTDIFRRAKADWKLCDGTETGNITGMSNTIMRKDLLIFRGNSPIIAATGGGIQSGTFSSGDPTGVTVAAGSGTSPLLVIGMYYADTSAITTRTFTVSGIDVKDGEVGFHSNLQYIAWKAYFSPGQSVFIDMGDFGNANVVGGFYIQVT